MPGVQEARGAVAPQLYKLISCSCYQREQPDRKRNFLRAKPARSTQRVPLWAFSRPSFGVAARRGGRAPGALARNAVLLLINEPVPQGFLARRHWSVAAASKLIDRTRRWRNTLHPATRTHVCAARVLRLITGDPNGGTLSSSRHQRIADQSRRISGRSVRADNVRYAACKCQ